MANELSTDKQANKMRNKDNIKKHLKRTAIGLAAGATLAATPGVVGAVKNVKAQNLNRQKAAQEYQMSQQELNARRNEMAKKIRDTGIEVGEDVSELAKKSSSALKKLYEDGKITLKEYKQALEQKQVKNSVVTETVEYFPY